MDLEERLARIDILDSVSRTRALSDAETNELAMHHKFVRMSSYSIMGQLEVAQRRMKRLSRIMKHPVIIDYIDRRQRA